MGSGDRTPVANRGHRLDPTLDEIDTLDLSPKIHIGLAQRHAAITVLPAPPRATALLNEASERNTGAWFVSQQCMNQLRPESVRAFGRPPRCGSRVRPEHFS